MTFQYFVTNFEGEYNFAMVGEIGENV